jgi:hypothetical protein
MISSVIILFCNVKRVRTSREPNLSCVYKLSKIVLKSIKQKLVELKIDVIDICMIRDFYIPFSIDKKSAEKSVEQHYQQT